MRVRGGDRGRLQWSQCEQLTKNTSELRVASGENRTFIRIFNIEAYVI